MWVHLSARTLSGSSPTSRERASEEGTQKSVWQLSRCKLNLRKIKHGYLFVMSMPSELLMVSKVKVDLKRYHNKDLTQLQNCNQEHLP